VCGAAALVVFIVIMESGYPSIGVYFAPVFLVLQATIGPPSSAPQMDGIYFFFLAVWAMWPQLLLALIGGFLIRYNAASGSSSSSHKSSDPHNP
jgi:hypothetical protein